MEKLDFPLALDEQDIRDALSQLPIEDLDDPYKIAQHIAGWALRKVCDNLVRFLEVERKS